MACLILSLTALLVMCSLYEMPSSSSQWPAISSGCPLSVSRFRRHTTVLRYSVTMEPLRLKFKGPRGKSGVLRMRMLHNEH